MKFNCHNCINFSRIYCAQISQTSTLVTLDLITSTPALLSPPVVSEEIVTGPHYINTCPPQPSCGQRGDCPGQV